MKKIIFILPFFLFFAKNSNAQTKGIAFSAGIHFPVGAFSSTHLAGIRVEVFPAARFFDSTVKKKIAVSYKAGLSYFIGRQERLYSSPYIYPGFFIANVSGSILFRPVKKVILLLSAGPAISLYNETARVNATVDLEGHYLFKGNISIGPILNLIKEFGADPLYHLGVKVGFQF